MISKRGSKMTNNLKPLISKNKKGMSAVISNLMIILLVIVAVGIVWTIIQGLIEDTEDEINLDDFNVKGEISESSLQGGEGVEITVKNSGEDDWEGTHILVNDVKGNTVEQVEKTDNKVLSKGQRTYTIDYSGIITEVVITPMKEDDDGEIKPGNKEVDTKVFGSEEILEDLGAVAWFKMDGDSYNEFGGGSGDLSEGADCQVSGKYKQACNLEDGQNMTYSGLNEGSEDSTVYWYKDEGEWNFCKNDSECSLPDGGDVAINDDDELTVENGVFDELIIFESELSEKILEDLEELDLTRN